MHFPPYETIGIAGSPELADAWVAFDFGDGGRYADGELRPGFANHAIASYLRRNATTVSYDTRRQGAVYRPKVQIFAQTLVAQELKQLCPGIEESELFVEVGTPTEEGAYVDSWRVANEARANTPWAQPVGRLPNEEQERRRQAGLPRGRIAVAAVAQHVSRAAWQTQRAYWTSAEVYVPTGLPETYAGPNSTQPWTTRPFEFHWNPKKLLGQSWWPREMVTRLLCGINGGEPSIANIKALPGLLVNWAKKKAANLTA